MNARFPLYDGAGNLFRMVDGRDGAPLPSVPELCLYPGGRTDGLIVLGTPRSAECDFSMQYFNADGSGGMMCGNGGRCIVAFAHDLGLLPKASDGRYRFDAPDGIHEGVILQDGPSDKQVRLTLTPVRNYCRVENPDGWFLDTGCRHFVTFLSSEKELGDLDINTTGPALRYHAAFAPEGVNVDFAVLRRDGTMAVRTYEKGVEAETRACGTGIVASSIAAAMLKERSGACHYDVDVRGGHLQADFIWNGVQAESVALTGPTHRH